MKYRAMASWADESEEGWTPLAVRGGDVYVGGPGPAGMWVSQKLLTISKRIVAAVKAESRAACPHNRRCVCEAMAVHDILYRVLARRAKR